MEQRCKNCDYWTKQPNVESGKCSSDKFINDYDGCPVDGVIFGSADDYGIWFNTGSEFGCVHFKLKTGE
jgi:hypothetical protein